MGINTNCKWLPPLVEKNSSENENDYLNRLYKIYVKDFKTTQPLFRGERVGLRAHPITNGFEEGFFHLTSRDIFHSGFENRKIDYERCKRFRWIRATIENYGCSLNCCNRILFINDKAKKNRIKLLFIDERYLIVLDHRKKGYYVVVTAFYLDENHEREFQKILSEK